MAAEHDHMAGNHGVISQAEAASLGIDRSGVQRRIDNGQWIRVGPGVSRAGGAPPTWKGSARALALSTGGLISHRGAARLFRLDGFEKAQLEVTVPYGKRRGAASPAIWHRSRRLDLASPAERLRVPCTGIARTILDLAGVLSLARLHEVVDEALRRRLTSWNDLEHVLEVHACRGRPGLTSLRRLVQGRFGEQRIPDSRWNRQVWQLLVDSGLSQPALEHEVFDAEGRLIGRIDLAYGAERLGIELDSRRYHAVDSAFTPDRVRSNRLINAGWRLLHFSWDFYMQHPEELVDTVRLALVNPRWLPPHQAA